MKMCVFVLLPYLFARAASAGIITPISTDRFVTAMNRETLPQTTVTNTGPALGPWQSTAIAANLLPTDPNFNINGSPCAITVSVTLQPSATEQVPSGAEGS
ncbi:MAG TPA: hypothetical protein PKE29_12795, partial [Phycisphaerales bacterium]|nr:hypothetical protein [Phycisphaerales bacterium]